MTAYEELAATPKLDPDTYMCAVAGLASALRAAGRRDDAEKRFEEALTFTPTTRTSPRLCYTLAENASWTARCTSSTSWARPTMPA